MEKTLNDYKKELKYKKYVFDNHEYEVVGIGREAIKAYKDGSDEPEYYRFNKPEGKYLGRKLLKTFTNALWNKVVQAKIEAQEAFCKENNLPNFTPTDGFCFSCGSQIWADKEFRDNSISRGKSYKSAQSEHITGCPHCYRSFCD